MVIQFCIPTASKPNWEEDEDEKVPWASLGPSKEMHMWCQVEQKSHLSS